MSFIAPLVGRTLMAEFGATFVYKVDGAVNGSLRARPVSGTTLCTRPTRAPLPNKNQRLKRIFV